MNKEFDDILAERLRILPSHTPGEDLWAGIEDALNADDVISRKLADLPVHRPAPANWNTIEASLPTGQLTRSRRRFISLPTASAAAILLMMVILRLLTTSNFIRVDSEILQTEEWSAVISGDFENEDPMELISDLCQSGSPVCETASFREMMKLYQELTEELRQLETVINQIGDSPEIIRSVIRIENMKSSTLQEMIQMIHS